MPPDTAKRDSRHKPPRRIYRATNSKYRVMIYDVHPCTRITGLLTMEITILTPWKDGGQLATVKHQKGGAVIRSR